MTQTDPLRVRLERSGRAGKTVTLVENLKTHPEGRRELLRALQKRLGIGGSLGAAALELQGDQRERLAEALAAMGYRVRRAN